VNSFDFDQAIKFKEHWLEEVKKQGRGELVFGKDSLPPTATFARTEDNCTTKLCPAR